MFEFILCLGKKLRKFLNQITSWETKLLLAKWSAR